MTNSTSQIFVQVQACNTTMHSSLLSAATNQTLICQAYNTSYNCIDKTAYDKLGDTELMELTDALLTEVEAKRLSNCVAHWYCDSQKSECDLKNIEQLDAARGDWAKQCDIVYNSYFTCLEKNYLKWCDNEINPYYKREKQSIDDRKKNKEQACRWAKEKSSADTVKIFSLYTLMTVVV
eukprot:Pgem_evm1s3205